MIQELQSIAMEEIPSVVKNLKKLSGKEYFSKFASVMMLAMIRDAAFYEWILDHIYEICEVEEMTVIEEIEKAKSILSFYENIDPNKEKDGRFLYFGKPIADAILDTGRKELLYGEALTLGMLVASHISYQRGFLSTDEFYEIRDMFVPFYLPISIDLLNKEKVVSYLHENCRGNNGISIVGLKKIGRAFMMEGITEDEILLALKEIDFDEDDLKA